MDNILSIEDDYSYEEEDAILAEFAEYSKPEEFTGYNPGEIPGVGYALYSNREYEEWN